MSEKKQELNICKGPFGTLKSYEGQKDFDKYYFDIQEKEVFKSSGVKDEDGSDLGVIEKKFIVKKLDISEVLNSQADSVGVEAYMKALTSQGESLGDYNTVVSDNIDDFSNMPDTLADVLTVGDKAKRLFAELDPALKGSHTTIEGFLGSLTQESVDNYIKGRIEALTPRKEMKENG